MIASVVAYRVERRICTTSRSSASRSQNYTACGIYFIVAALLLAMLSGCGIGYQVVPARLAIVDVPRENYAALAGTVHDFLIREGFEEFGKAEETIALIRSDTTTPDKMKREELARLEREWTYLNQRHDLRVVLSDYVDGVPSEISFNFTPPSDHFVELEISDERPGGFGPYGLAFYGRFLAALQNRYGASVRVVSPPPPTNEAEYRRITRHNDITSAFWLAFAFALPFLITGFISYHLLKKARIPKLLKRLIFSLLNGWLVAPLPFPAASILVIPAPNFFAFPWTNIDYYSRIKGFAAVSFPVTLLLCAVASMFLFRRKVETQRAGAPV
jgi:hypothetical protein